MHVSPTSAGARPGRSVWWYVLFLLIVDFVLGIIVSGPMVVGGVSSAFSAAQTGASAAGKVQAPGAVADGPGRKVTMMWVSGGIEAADDAAGGASSLVRCLAPDPPDARWWAALAVGAQVVTLAITLSMVGNIEGTMAAIASSGDTSPAVLQQVEISRLSLLGWIAPLLVLVFGVLKSSPGPNRYGEAPQTADLPAPCGGARQAPHGGDGAKRPGLPSAEQVLEFIRTADGPAGKREIAREFGLKGQERSRSRSSSRDMAEEGLIDGKQERLPPDGRGAQGHRAAGGRYRRRLARSPFPIPGSPTMASRRRECGSSRAGRAARCKGDRVLARTEESRRGWRAHPIKKLPARGGAMLGVIELDGAGKPWLAPVDKRVRNSFPVVGHRRGARRASSCSPSRSASRSAAGCKVVEVLGDPLAPRAFSLIAIHKYGIPHVFPEAALAEAELAAKLPLSEDKREDLRHLPIVAIDPSDARDHDDAIWAEPDGRAASSAVVAIADVSFYVRPGGQVDSEARKRGNSVYFPDRVVPMLPEVLSADVCSSRKAGPRGDGLPPGIDAQGRVSEFRFSRALVRIAEVIATRTRSAI